MDGPSAFYHAGRRGRPGVVLSAALAGQEFPHFLLDTEAYTGYIIGVGLNETLARRRQMASMTVRQALDHVWNPDGVSLGEARELLRQGSWANGSRLEGREVPALEALASGAGPDDEVEVPAGWEVVMTNLRQIDQEGRWGYEEVWGDEPRYHGSEEGALACCTRLNANDFGGIYEVRPVDPADAVHYGR
jgi:hypothetical protein